MQEVANIQASHMWRSIDVRLWGGILLAPFAGGINTMVGYMVSNYDCNVHNRSLVLLVNLLAFVLCGFAFFLSFSANTSLDPYRKPEPSPESGPQNFDPANLERLPSQSRVFMVHLGYWLSAGFALFILAGTLSTLLLGPCDL
ncbi:MAG TPA: hypothetical protein VFE38_13305 [Edaphobacter sp.]|nr:hypothetical protein [Edaphobacter sp.]